MNVHAARRNLLGQYFNEQRTPVVTLNLEVMPSWRRLEFVDIRPGFFTTGVQQAVIGQRHHGSLFELRLFKWDTERHQPLEVLCTALGISPDLNSIGLGSVTRHQVAVNIVH